MIEEWKQYKEYPQYEISNMGRVKLISTGNIKKDQASGTNKGRRQVKLWNKKTNAYVTYHVDRLVLDVFNPNPNPFKYKRVIHIDKNLSNNRLDNLKWATVKEYYAHMFDKRSKKYGVNYCELDDDVVAYIQKNYIKGDYEFGARPLGRKFDLDHKLVARIGNKEIRPEG